MGKSTQYCPLLKACKFSLSIENYRVRENKVWLYINYVYKGIKYIYWNVLIVSSIAPPDVSQYQYEETSGYYYDPSTGLYYDANTQVSQ